MPKIISRTSYILAKLALLAIMFSGNAIARAPESFADLVDELLPTVVNISTTQKVKNQVAISPFGFQDMFPRMPGQPDPFQEFREFFEHRFEERAIEREVSSLGSGFIVDRDGYIVTNNHVIAGADEISVTLSDKRSFLAKVVGRDPKTDLALLKIDVKENLPYVKFGDSDKARVGDWVLAIGNPFKLGGTVTAGIISARARDINSGPFDDFIQTDAAINRGNSGGPMFNIDGEVIGINTAIFSPNGGNIGIGFAVPSAMARPVLEQLKDSGKVRRGWLGVKIQTVNSEIAESIGLKEAKGALVVEVNDNSPAQEAGIIPGDVILKFNGEEIEEMRQLPRIVAESKIGDKTPMVIWRKGQRKNIRVELGELDVKDYADNESEYKDSKDKDGIKDGESIEVQGMTIQNLDNAIRRKYGLDKNQNGVLVIDVAVDSDAYERGIRIGDVIVNINNTKLSDIKDAKKALINARRLGRKNALTAILRRDELMYVTIPTK